MVGGREGRLDITGRGCVRRYVLRRELTDRSVATFTLSWARPTDGPQGRGPAAVNAVVRRALEALNAVVPKDPARIVVHSQPDFEDGALAMLGALEDRGGLLTLLCEDARTAKRAPGVLGRPIEAV